MDSSQLAWMAFQHLIDALKKRVLVQWLIAYLAVAWLALQLFSILADQFHWPPALERSLTVLLAIGILIVGIVGWYHGEEGRQRISPVELVMLAIVVLIAGAGLKLVQRAPTTAALAEPPGLPLAHAAPPRASVAVLPFVNLSGDSRDEYFSDGFTEQLIDGLANVPDLKVASRTSAFAFRNKQADIADIGRKLGVQNVLEGSIRRAGNRIRVTAQLINVADGFHVWSKTYERSLDDIFAVQDELSRVLVNELDISLNTKASGSPPTRDAEAYDLYLRGLYHFRQSGFQSDSAIHYLERATQRDPRFAQAMGALGQAYQARNFSVGNTTPEYRQKAFIAIEKALRLDPQQVEALIARSNTAYTIERGFNMEAAAADLRRALEINPRSSRVHEVLGSLYHHVGLNERALREFRTALELDPQSDFAAIRIPRTLMFQGKFEEALRIMQARPDLDRNVQWPLALWYNGRKEEALEAARAQVASAQTNHADFHSVYALVLSGMGQHAEADEQIAAAIERGAGNSHFHHAAHNIASAYALMNRKAEAMQWLRRVAREGMPNYELFLRDPNLNNLRRDGDFGRFLEEQRKLWLHYGEVL